MQLEKAKVQYNDLVGTAALDFHGGMHEDLHGYAKDFGIDVEAHWPVGLEIYFGEGGGFYLDFICVLEKEVDAYKAANNGRIPLIRISREASKEDFFNRVKRFDIHLMNKDNFLNHEIIKEMNVEDEIEDLPVR